MQGVNPLLGKTLVRFGRRFVLVSLCLFLPAWSLNFWQAWVFLIVAFIPDLLIVSYLLRKDPALLERRLKGGPRAETRTSQKVIAWLIRICFFLLALVSGFDHRFGWSHIPAFLVIIADAAVLAGGVVQFYALKANTFASAIVATVPNQEVISTGPYAVVRHPFYAGALLADVFFPIALGSWWGLPFAPAMLFVIVARLLDEEQFLRRGLPGYEEYCRRVRYRLIPHVW